MSIPIIVLSMKKEMFDTVDNKILKSFQILKKIGQGAYGQVWKVKNKKTGTIRALKKICDAFNTPFVSQKTYRQVKYLLKLNHPNIVKLHALHSSSTEQEVYLQLEFMEADLSLALKNSLLKPIHKHYIFYQLANALTYLHSAQLIHRDLKPTNILVNQVCDVKICDFGLIRSVAKDFDLTLTERIATRWYRAPQNLLGTKHYGKAVDIWSLGCVLAEMILHQPLFQGTSALSQLQKIFQVTGPPQISDLQFLENEAAVKLALSIQIKQKKSLKNILKSDDVDLLDLLEKIFQVNPSKRPSAEQILSHPFLQKFRGKVEEKNSLQPIKILYQNSLLSPEQYRQLLFEELSQKQKPEEKQHEDNNLIFKTLPQMGHQTFFKKININPKNFMHHSHLNHKMNQFAKISPHKDISPMREVSREELIKKSPSFLKNKKKVQDDEKVLQTTPEKNVQKPTKKIGILRKQTFPFRNSPSDKKLNLSKEKEGYVNPEFPKLSPEKGQRKLSKDKLQAFSPQNTKLTPDRLNKLSIFRSMGVSSKIPKEQVAHVDVLSHIFAREKDPINPASSHLRMLNEKQKTPSKGFPLERVKKSPQNEQQTKVLKFKPRASPPLAKAKSVNLIPPPFLKAKK